MALSYREQVGSCEGCIHALGQGSGTELTDAQWWLTESCLPGPQPTSSVKLGPWLSHQQKQQQQFLTQMPKNMKRVRMWGSGPLPMPPLEPQRGFRDSASSLALPMPTARNKHKTGWWPYIWSNCLLRSLRDGRQCPRKTTERNKQNICCGLPFSPSNYISSSTPQRRCLLMAGPRTIVREAFLGLQEALKPAVVENPPPSPTPCPLAFSTKVVFRGTTRALRGAWFSSRSPESGPLLGTEWTRSKHLWF